MSSRRLTGRSERPSLNQKQSTSALNQQMSLDKPESPELSVKTSREDTSTDAQALLDQVTQWLQDEKFRRGVGPSQKDEDIQPNEQVATSDQDQSLEKLEHILKRFAASSSISAAQAQRQASMPSPRVYGRRASIARALLKSKNRSTQASDADAGDAVATVPHVEALLDNTKTLAYSGGAADIAADDADRSKDQKCWDTFKEDTVRLTHTLGLRGWRRLDLQYASAIHIERLSGAMTNAVYVVKPPKDYTLMQRKDENGNLVPIKKQPKELLLRIYGPNVEHLIDRENELMILRRLAAKNIGPKLLGYFDNGRFEEFLHAKTLGYSTLR